MLISNWPLIIRAGRTAAPPCAPNGVDNGLVREAVSLVIGHDKVSRATPSIITEILSSDLKKDQQRATPFLSSADSHGGVSDTGSIAVLQPAFDVTVTAPVYLAHNDVSNVQSGIDHSGINPLLNVQPGTHDCIYVDVASGLGHAPFAHDYDTHHASAAAAVGLNANLTHSVYPFDVGHSGSPNLSPSQKNNVSHGGRLCNTGHAGIVVAGNTASGSAKEDSSIRHNGSGVKNLTALSSVNGVREASDRIECSPPGDHIGSRYLGAGHKPVYVTSNSHETCNHAHNRSYLNVASANGGTCSGQSLHVAYHDIKPVDPGIAHSLDSQNLSPPDRSCAHVSAGYTSPPASVADDPITRQRDIIDAIWPDVNPEARAQAPEFFELYENIKAYSTPNYLGARIPVKSGLNLEAWVIALAHYHDKELWQYLRYGWPIGYHKHSPPASLEENHQSATQHLQDVRAFINKELSYGALVGPFDSSPLYLGCESPQP